MAKATVDVNGLTERLQPLLASVFPTAGVPTLIQMPTGMSSVTYTVDFTDDSGPQRIAVKLAPPGLAPVRNRDVLRQARVLRALDGAHGVVVPQVLFEDEGAPPEVPPLFGMTFVAGQCFEPLSDDGEPPPPEIVDIRARSAARMLAALHEVPTRNPVIGDEAEIPLADEVQRWIRLFDSVDEELRPPTAVPCGERLLASIPAAIAPALIHGDYRLGNIIYEGKEPRAIIDWEIWSVEDPRVDLAWFLLNSDPRKPNTVRPDVGMPPTDELVAAYEERRGESVADLAWFSALVRFKQAAISAFIVKNNRKRENPDPRQERIAPFIPALLAAAMEYLDRSGP